MTSLIRAPNGRSHQVQTDVKRSDTNTDRYLARFSATRIRDFQEMQNESKNSLAINPVVTFLRKLG